MMTVLPTPAPPKRPILPPLQVRLEQVDDLDARLEHLELGRLLFERRRLAVDRPALLRLSTGRSGKSTGSPSTLSTRPSVCGPTGTVIGPPVSMRLHAALHAVGRLHRDGAHAVLAEVLLDLDDDVDRPGAARPSRLDAHGVVDRRQVAVRELDVDDRADDLDDLADVLCCSANLPLAARLHSVPGSLSYSACAPDTTSMISRVIAAWRTLFM